jgi:hypothetical protein
MTTTYPEPIPGEYYRDCATGRAMRLLHCRRDGNLIGCVFDAQEWWGTVGQFWKQFTHEEARQ